MKQQEIELEKYLLGGVNNVKSNDYLQNYYFTHSCVDGNNEIWYKAYTEYTVENTTALWFKETEIEWCEGLDENELEIEGVEYE